jgi:hypothetical protein
MYLCLLTVWMMTPWFTRPGSENKGIKQVRHCDLSCFLCTDWCMLEQIPAPNFSVYICACLYKSYTIYALFVSCRKNLHAFWICCFCVTFLVHWNLINSLTILKTLKASFIHYFMALLDRVQFQWNVLCLQLKLIILRNERKW